MKSKNKSPSKKTWLRKLMSPQHVLTATFFVAAIVCFSFVTTAKTTYIINDGSDSVTISTYTDDASAAIAQAGFTLDNGDDYTSENTSDGVNVNIDRAKTVELTYGGGKTVEVSTQAKNVGEFISEQNLVVDADDIVNHADNELIYNGMKVNIDIVRVKNRTIEVSTSYTTNYTDTDTLAAGEENVVTEGVRGTSQISYTAKYVNGQCEDFDVTNNVVVTAPTAAEVQRGTGTGAAASTTTSSSTTSAAASTSAASTSSTSASSSGLSYSYSLSMTATAYTCDGTGLGPYTASGALAQVGIVAADTSVLPLGTKVYITSADGSWTYGYAVVGDTGVSGSVIDLYFDTYGECISFGAQSCIVYVIG